MRLRHVASEAGIGLRRNLTLTVAAVVTTAVSLVLLGGGVLVRQQVARLDDLYQSKIQVVVYLNQNVTQDQRTLISDTISADPLVKSVRYESKEQAFKRFQAQNRDNPSLFAELGPDMLPESYQLTLQDPRLYRVAQARYSPLPGVETVNDASAVLAPFFRLFDGVAKVAYIVAAIQLLAAGLLIVNTVRVSAFGRRRETGIMRLVGASSLSIQLPFLVEGVVAGLLGAAIACGGLALGKLLVVDRILVQAVGAQIVPPLQWSDFTGTMLLLVVVGVVLSVVSSVVTLQRHLRV